MPAACCPFPPSLKLRRASPVAGSRLRPETRKFAGQALLPTSSAIEAQLRLALGRSGGDFLGGRGLSSKFSVEYGLQLFEIIEEGVSHRALVKSCGGVEKGNDQKAPLSVSDPVGVRDRELGIEKRGHCETAQRGNDSRPQQRYLRVEVFSAGFYLVWLRIAVVRRTALDDVRDIHILSLYADALEKLGEKLAGGADEWARLLVLVITRRLANE
jgi:hypothetical protein